MSFPRTNAQPNQDQCPPRPPHARLAYASRRGSFLVTVVGILALLAVLTVVYVSLGRSDSQAAAATARAAARDEVPEQVRDYIAAIIADDVFDTYDPTSTHIGDGVSPLLPPRIVREAWDHPSAPYQVTFVDPITGDIQRRPVTVGGEPGDDFALFTPTGEVRVELSDGSVIRVGSGTDPWLSASEPTVLDLGLDWQDPAEYTVRRRDLANITNIAPDGAFVNLFNLRDDPGDDDDGFGASPLRMRQGVNLLASGDAADFDSPTTRTTTTEWGEDVTISSDDDALRTRPSFWGSRQTDLHHPARDPDFGPDAPEFLHYQFADADGDGILDSRWFEPVEARTDTPAEWRFLFDRPDAAIRWFIAAKIIDLSGRVNINTAADGTVEPQPGLGPSAVDLAHPMLSPASVDVRRLLSMYDLGRDGVLALTPDLVFSDAPYSAYDEAVAFEAGDRGYDALRAALLSGQGPLALQQNPGFDGLAILTDGLIDLEFSNGDNLLALGAAYGRTGPAFASDYFDITAPRLGGVGYDDGQSSYLRGSGFGLEDLAELLARRALNDDQVESALEAVLFGRGDDATAAEVSPLRSNRSLADERAGWVNTAGRRQQKFFEQSLLDVRQRLTTISGARAIRPTAFDVLSGAEPSTGDLELDAGDLPRRIDETLFDPGQPATEPLDGNPRLAMFGDAMIPALPDFAWNPAPEFLTLSYGYRGAEVAWRTAAALTANLLDMGDTDGTPTRRTLVLNRAALPLTDDGADIFRSGSADPAAPWPLLFPGDLRVDPGVAIFADGPVVNVFGIEAQPFLTQMAAVTVYTDTPLAEGGNMDWSLISITLPDGTTQTTIDPTVPPDINGSVGVGNVDFLFEAIAFQVHNPFDEPVDLSLNGEAVYYIEFGDRYYKLTDAAYDAPSNSFGPEAQLTLAPAGTVGDTMTFYVLSQDSDDIAARLAGRTALAASGITADQIINNWAAEQFGSTHVTPVRVFPFDPTTGVLTPAASYQPFLDLHADKTGDAESRKVARLWRVEKPQADFGYPVNTSIIEGPGANDLATDVLADRLRQTDVSPGAPVELDRRLPPSQIEVAGATAGDEGDLSTDHDNKGLTIARYASVRRADDPDQGNFATRVYRNVLPAYCIESKNPDATHANALLDDGSPPTYVRKIDFSTGALNAERQLDQWWTEQTDNAANASIESLTDAPYDKSGEDIGANRAGATFTGAGDIIIRPVFHLDNNEFLNAEGRPIFRPADILLPLGIAPTHSPGPNLGDPADDEWTTLSEAMALALAYENTAGTADPRTNTLYADAFNNFTDRALLEGGALVYDTYIPFTDEDTDGLYSPDGVDLRESLALTPAMRLLDALRNTEPSLLAIDRAVPGTINLNTAPVEVLRTLPMLSPPDGIDPVTGLPLWWWDGATPPHDRESDIAASIAGYRDRAALFPRTPAGFTPTIADRLNFLDPPPFSFAPAAPPGESPDDDARADVTGIPGLEERPGIRALGEILAARDLNITQWSGGAQPNPHSIDRLAFDGLSISHPGVARAVPDGAGGFVTDGYADDPSEAFAVVNPLLAAASVRSDVYAVWFVIHGYQESDTTDLPDDQVLAPSIARRFMAIVDRSNVTQPGQAPRILYYRELPL